MALDHGTLNVSLSKRGNINAQLDRYKAEQAADRKSARKAAAEKTAKLRVEAKALLSKITDERVASLATMCGVTQSAMRSRLKSDAHWQPELIISLLSREAA